MESKTKGRRIVPLTDYLSKNHKVESEISFINRKKYERLYKETLPLDWEIVEVKNVCNSIQSGFASGERDDNGILQLRMNNITTDGHIILNSYLKVPILNNIDNYTITNGDILFNNTNSVDLIGKTAIFRDECKKCTYSNHLTRIRVNEQMLIPEWILYNFIRLWEKGYFKRICQRHVGQSGISSDDLEKTLISKPPLIEQRKIAAILSTVDASIEATERIIIQMNLLKKAIIELLFSKGIGNTEFVNSDIELIPKKWKIVPIKEYIAQIKSGLSRKIVGDDIGLPVITSTNIKNAKLDVSELRYWYVNDPQGADTSEYILNDGDILLNFINSRAQIGKCCLNQYIGRKSIYTTNIFRIIADTKITSPSFLFYLINSNRVQREIKCIAKPAVNQASFTIPDFESILVPFIPITEQNEIVSIVDTINEKIDRELEYCKQLETIKKALMQVLLTGKVRVEVDS